MKRSGSTSCAGKSSVDVGHALVADVEVGERRRRARRVHERAVLDVEAVDDTVAADQQLGLGRTVRRHRVDVDAPTVLHAEHDLIVVPEGSRCGGYGPHWRSRLSVKIERSRVAGSSTAICVCRPQTHGSGVYRYAMRVPSGDQAGSLQLPSPCVSSAAPRPRTKRGRGPRRAACPSRRRAWSRRRAASRRATRPARRGRARRR